MTSIDFTTLDDAKFALRRECTLLSPQLRIFLPFRENLEQIKCGETALIAHCTSRSTKHRLGGGGMEIHELSSNCRVSPA